MIRKLKSLFLFVYQACYKDQENKVSHYTAMDVFSHVVFCNVYRVNVFSDNGVQFPKKQGTS